MIRRTKKIVLIGLICSLSLPVFAFQATNIPNQYPTIGRTVRPLGLGNSFLTMKGTDDASFYYNPAAINDYDEKKSFNVFSGIYSMQFALTTKTISMIKDIKDLQDDIDAATTDNGKIDAFNTFFNNHVGELHSIGLWMPFFSVRSKRYFASIILDSRTDISLRNRAFPNFEFSSQDVSGVAGGTAFDFFDETLQVGVGIKVLYKLFISEIITTADALGGTFGNKFDISNWRKGVGVGGDLGVKYKLPNIFHWELFDTLKPTVAVSYQDIGNTRFTGNVPNISQTVNAGIGVHPEFREFDLSFLVDFREITDKKDLLMKLHAGAEARFGKHWKVKPSVRVGTNQGYLAGGAGIKVGFFHIDAAYYTQEVGLVTRQKGSQNIVGSIGFEI